MGLIPLSTRPSHPPSIATALLVAAALAVVSAPLRAQDFSQPDSEPAPQAALVQKANAALATGDLPAALKILTTLNTQTPNNSQVLYDLGLTLEALADTSPTSASGTPPTVPQPATCNLQPATPESCYRAAIAADPNFAPPHAALGLLLARANRSAEARTELLAATTLPSAEPALKARAFRALARLDLNGKALPGGPDNSPPNLAPASDELLAAIKLTSEQPADVLLSAEVAEAAADLPAAESAYRRFLALTPDDPEATAALAHILLAERHPADAEALLAPALALAPGNPSFTAQLAEAYLASGDPTKTAQAVPLVEALHTKNPANPNITRLLARVYVETGHLDQADPLYASLLAAQAAHPDPTLLDDRAEVLLRLHRPGEAESLLKQAVANRAAFPTPTAFADAATHLAFAASEIDDPRMTLQALALRATVQQPSPSSLYLEATANDALHQTSKAVQLYKQFLAAAGEDFPDEESQARQRLAALESRK
jgi:Flp pilus assembly protein TadD